MKPVLEYLPVNSGESFVTRYFDYPYYPTPWHFHPEYELVLVTESTGKRFIGDHISEFGPGNLALLGPYLPHNYRNAPQYFAKKSKLRARSIVVHFKETSFGKHFLELPESQKIKQLLGRSFKGITITGVTNKIISEKLLDLVEAKEFSRWLILIEILHILSTSNDCYPICKEIITGQNINETNRMNLVIEFVIKNFNRQIALNEVADIAHMAENSFSRYFSQRTRRPFTSFVNEVRLNHASKLLLETNKSITEICSDCGFNNLSNFNRQFRRLYDLNPKNLRKIHSISNQTP